MKKLNAEHFILEIQKEIKNLNSNIKTGEVRKISSYFYESIKNLEINEVLSICTKLLDKRHWALGVIAYDFAYRKRKKYTQDTYFVFYRWLKDYIRGWSDCDNFCTHAFGELLRQNKDLFTNVLSWTADKDFWVRRASAVVLIPSIRHNDYKGINPFMISDHLMTDEHYLVQKGYGWMLKVLSQKDQMLVKEYLIKNCKVMPRVAYRYALEKFNEITRKEMLSI